MPNIKAIGVALLLVICLGATGQTEGETWVSVKVQKKLSDKFKVFMEPQLRWTDTEMQRRLLETGLEYEPIKYFSTTFIHRYSLETTNNGRVNEHRFALDFNGKTDVNNWEPELRIRYTNLKDFNEDGGANFLRYRAGVGYDIKKIKTKPEVSLEVFQELAGNTIRKLRYTMGATYDINKKWSTGLSYKREDFKTKQKFVNIVDFNLKIKI